MLMKNAYGIIKQTRNRQQLHTHQDLHFEKSETGNEDQEEQQPWCHLWIAPCSTDLLL